MHGMSSPRGVWTSGRTLIAFPCRNCSGSGDKLVGLANVANPPLDLAQSQPLPNTGYVVVRGNPQDGWTLLDWNATKLN